MDLLTKKRFLPLMAIGALLGSLVIVMASRGIPEQELVVATKTLKLVFQQSEGRWSLYQRKGEGWETLISSAASALTLGSQELVSTVDLKGSFRGMREKVTTRWGEGELLELSAQLPHQELLLKLQFILYHRFPGAILQLSLTNQAPSPLTLRVVDMIEGSPPTELNLGPHPNSAKMLINGYHSWDRAVVEPIGTGRRLTSYWNTACYNPASKEGVVLGWITNLSSTNTLNLQSDEQRLRFQARADFGQRDISPGEELAADQLLILCGKSPISLLEKYARLSYEATWEKSRSVGSATRAEVPTGWCSWYYYYDRVKEADIIENLNFAAVAFKPFGFQYIQIDDGFQQAAGDWNTNQKFPHGHRWLTDQIHHQGLKAGLWVAPFAIAEKSSVFEEHPDWLIKDEEGKSLQVWENEFWGGKIYALDPTHPEARQWLSQLFRRVVNEWGYDYVKIDFVFFAARGGVYHQALSPIEACRLGLETIRKAVGEGRFILGCGAPLGPSIGVTDGMRIGQDVSARWESIIPCILATANRFFFHRQVWFNDPDCLVVRPPLSLQQAQVWASVVSLSGGINLFSDRLIQLTEERIRILQRTLPVYSANARPIDMWDIEEATTPILSTTGDEEAPRTIPLDRVWLFKKGDDIAWKEPELDVGDWTPIPIGIRWEDAGYQGYDGYGWYRLKFTIPEDWTPGPLVLELGKIDDVDATYMNGKLIGATGKFPPEAERQWYRFRRYNIPQEAVNWAPPRENLLAIRVYDGGGSGGFYQVNRGLPPQIWLLPVSKEFDRWWIVGVFNFREEEDTIQFPFSRLGLSERETYLAFDYWQEKFLGEFTGEMKITLEPTSCRVIALHIKQKIPQIISTDRHITQGGVDLEEVVWMPGEETLQGLSTNLAGTSYTLTLYHSPQYKLGVCQSAVPCTSWKVSPSIYRFRFKINNQPELRWKVKFFSF
ncbi:MAG: alpha-galactosidase [Candidatus Aminicenantes bacterium]|nr:alpha-galactosidase [Candidatus Aminicenantes bacterium]